MRRRRCRRVRRCPIDQSLGVVKRTGGRGFNIDVDLVIGWPQRRDKGVVVKIAVSWPVPPHLVGPGFTTEVFSSRMTRVYEPTRTAADYALQELSFLEAAVRAEAAGADAYFIHSGGDYGLELIRESLSIPAFGGIEPSIAAASVVGPPFGIV